MTQGDENPMYLSSLPTELLVQIFSLLSGKQLMRSRQVCHRWKEIIDGLSEKDAFWKNCCEKEYFDIYMEARKNARPDLPWFNIYRSLSLWPRLPHAREIKDEFSPDTFGNDEIISLQVLSNGTVGVHKMSYIVYYDMESLKPTSRPPIPGNYATYLETDDFVLLVSYQSHLFLTRKVQNSSLHEPHVAFDNVSILTLYKRNVYYATKSNDIYVVDLNDISLTARFLKHMDESIMSIGYKDEQLIILTSHRNIYTLYQDNLTWRVCLKGHRNILDQLYRYRLLEDVDWTVYCHWAIRTTGNIGSLNDIIAIKLYGDMVFVGFSWGVLNVYHAPYINGELDFYHVEPLKQYDLTKQSTRSRLDSIMKIDIIESEEGHTMLLVMPRKVTVINLVHNFKRTSSVAMLPYDDLHRLKVIKLD